MALDKLRIKLWQEYRVAKLNLKDDFLLILLEFDLPKYGEAELYLEADKKTSGCIGRIIYRLINTVPVGRITPDVWARSLGPCEEEFVAKAQEAYGLPGFDRFCQVWILEAKLTRLERGVQGFLAKRGGENE